MFKPWGERFKDPVIELSKERSVSHPNVSAHRYADPILLT